MKQFSQLSLLIFIPFVYFHLTTYTEKLTRRYPLVGMDMTESGDPNQKAMAERVLRSLKDDCKLARGFFSFSTAEEAVERAINAYNTVRPHA